jgi:hypothetical protein
MAVYEKGAVRIHYQDTGTGIPLLILPGGGLNATMSFFKSRSPLMPLKSLKMNIVASPWTRAMQMVATPQGLLK